MFPDNYISSENYVEFCCKFKININYFVVVFVQSYKLLPCKRNIKLYEYNTRSLIMELNNIALYYFLYNLILIKFL